MKAKKTISLVLCAVILVAMSIAGTVAYFTDQEGVTNTFSVGSIGITMDETDVDEYGIPLVPESSADPEVDPVKGNRYRLIPGKTYVKDPTIHVVEGSESSWLFVKVENGISAIETTEAGKTIHEQILANEWNDLPGVANVYYKEWIKGSDVDVDVFESFTISGTADNTAIANHGSAKVIVTGYAMQMAGFEGKPADAWTAANFS